jgi:hypothetical protein
MLIHSLADADNSRCVLVYEEANQWLRATWIGHVDPAEAQRGAESYLAKVGAFHCPYLLNNNQDLRGPWFDSVEWLERIWLPHALTLGLRYVAHVTQSDTHADVLTLAFPLPLVGVLDLQVFEDVPSAEAWLRTCQERAEAPPD